jgi:hypothetical protein
MIINFILCLSIESVGSCSHNDTNNGTSLLFITFDSGSDLYLNKTPTSFCFNTTYAQKLGSKSEPGYFGFVNAVPNVSSAWHDRAPDHTENDTAGYMFLVDLAEEKETQLFNATVNGLCIGVCYEFSAYLANIVKKGIDAPKPKVSFEVRATTVQKDLLAKTFTGDIPEYDNMTWSKHDLSFIASNTSVVLLIIPNVAERSGNDLAIDDIELRVCPTVQTGFCSSGWYIYYFLNMI